MMKRTFLYIGLVLGIFIISFAALYVIGAVPSEFQFVSAPTFTFSSTGSSASSSTPAASSSGGISNANVASAAFPQRVIIPSIGVNSPILNPDTTDVVVLNADLLKGAVRYPGSGALGVGTVFMFGHNTGLPAINQAYKTFNGLRKIQTGAQIEVDSATTRYFYTVKTLSLVDDTDYVDISATDNELVISTCNVFGEKEQRYVVHATFTSSSPLSSSTG